MAESQPRINGEPLDKLPEDLYIPPDALEIFLDAFEGPLDLLLYLIRRQNLDILDIPVQRICAQYIEYIDLMRELRFELAAEYLVMAAWLAEIKSRMLLPKRQDDDEDDAEDPRAELVRRLQEYERFKEAAEALDRLPRVGRDVFPAQADPGSRHAPPPAPIPDLLELLHALRDVLQRAELFSSHQIQREPLSVRERMSRVLDGLQNTAEMDFVALFTPAEGRTGVVVTLLAILELAKGALIEVLQLSNGLLRVRAAGAVEAAAADEAGG